MLKEPKSIISAPISIRSMRFGSIPIDFFRRKSVREPLKIESFNRRNYGRYLLVAFLGWVLFRKTKSAINASQRNLSYSIIKASWRCVTHLPPTVSRTLTESITAGLLPKIQTFKKVCIYLQSSASLWITETLTQTLTKTIFTLWAWSSLSAVSLSSNTQCTKMILRWWIIKSWTFRWISLGRSMGNNSGTHSSSCSKLMKKIDLIGFILSNLHESKTRIIRTRKP